ncbi:MAG: Response regulator of the LytR/AlgR family, partial [Bacteroidetes bacterium]|nr:Response regulator of the LytR/AlgR family [Bacteroidota bacterium]
FIAQSRTSYLYTKDKNRYIVDYSLDLISKQLDPRHFYRLSRECYARFDSIKDISKYIKGRIKITLEPEYESDIIISQERASEFLRWIDGE